ncbi:hypothetical protein INT47_007187, partial [Mucor saturninus]
EPNQLINITEENLHCHHLLFNQDVTTATYDPQKDCFSTKTTQLSFRRAKLNGIIVVQKTVLSNYCIWLGKVILPKYVLKREDADLLVVPNNVTVFGKVELVDKEHVLTADGFRIETNEAVEMYHWLRVLQERPKTTLAKGDKNMFCTLSSLPSPTRLLKDNFLGSPIRGSQNTGYLWSPDHSFATSTPIRAVQESQAASPLRQRSIKLIPVQEDDDDDEFDDFGSIDLIALENNALMMASNNKRKFDFANMD